MLRLVLLGATLLGLSANLLNASLLDTSFNPGSGAGGGIVEQVLPLSDGKILLCGNFTSFNGRSKAYVVRLNNDGSVDETFTASPGYWVRNMAVQPDGKIVIGGFFTTVQGVPRNLIARLNSNGSLDSSFNPGSGARDIIAGAIDGNIDPFVFWVAVQTDGKILATGNFRNYNGASSTGVVRINPDGSRDTSFNVGGGLDSWGRHIRLMPNGQILLSGWLTSYSGQSFNRIARINPDGSPDPTFTPFFGDRTAIYCTALVGDGRIIATGHSLNYEGLFSREMARLNADGTIDESFVGFTNEKTESAVIQPDGKVIVGGNFSKADNVSRPKIARFNPDGTLDNSLSANIDNYVWSVALQSDGKLLISGGFYTVDGVSRVGVARLLTGISSGGGSAVDDVGPVLRVTGSTVNSLSLAWDDSSTIRTGYILERKVSNGSFEAIASLSSGARSYTVTGLTAGTIYIFRLRASNTSGAYMLSNEASGTTSFGSGGSGKAVFAGTDTVTRGSWKGKYGADGYAIFGDSVRYPNYVTVAPTGKSDWTWQWLTQDAAGLERASGTDRLAACWYAAGEYVIDLRFTDALSHRTAIYFLDWDLAGRNQTVRILDGVTSAVLDIRSVSNFGQGLYFQWDLAGHVKISITANNVNGVSSGIFFGSGGASSGTVETPVISPNGGTFLAPRQVIISSTTTGAEIRYTLDGTEPSAMSALYSSPITVSSSSTLRARGFKSGMIASAIASASFVIQASGGSGSAAAAFIGKDTVTRGDWKGVYGSEGYYVIGKAPLLPVYAQLSTTGKNDWIWNDNTTDSRALLMPTQTGRIASCWYANGSFDIHLNVTDGRTHRLALYLCDWDNGGRSERVDLLDATNGALLNSQNVSAFSGGHYLIWDVKGNVRLRVTRLSGYNAVVGGVFFGPAATQL